MTPLVESDLALPADSPGVVRAGWRPKVDPSLLRECTRLAPWRTIAMCLVLHASVVALAWAGGPASGWWLAPAAVLVIAGLQHHLLILLHESAHGLVHPNRRVNDLIADVFCAIPFFTLARFYRRLHLLHHKHVGSAEDPELQMYAAMGWHHERRGLFAWARMLLADLCGLSLLRFSLWTARFVKEQSAKGVAPFGPRDLLLNLLVWGPVVAVAWGLGLWVQVLVFWFLPLATVTTLVGKVHGYLEHSDASGPSEYDRTLVHELHPLVDFWVYPFRSGYHLEHHLFPRVPWYHMDRFRAALLADPEHARRARPVTVDGLVIGERPAFQTFLLREEPTFDARTSTC